ncbi:hypothetical protein BDQ17DRAFT_1336606 [Cyathus striatus]|nr:hypothetical protein BDQ17DRAFT_1336606 [Cyathus striatus]
MNTSIFPNASNPTICQANFIDKTNGRTDQYDAPKCHPETCKQLLSDIQERIKVPKKETGAGKSCIALSTTYTHYMYRILLSTVYCLKLSKNVNILSEVGTTSENSLKVAVLRKYCLQTAYIELAVSTFQSCS